MDQPSDKTQRPQDAQPPAPGGEQPQDEQPKQDDEVKSATDPKSTDEEPEAESQERHVSIGLREIIAAVIGGVILIVIGIVVLHNNGNGVVVPEPPKLPQIPPAQEAKDRAVPNAKGPVREQVWAPEATTFAEPFKLEGAGQPIPHNEYVLVSCKLYWPHPESVEEEGYWYRIITKPWKSLFSPANSFWDGDKPGEKPTHSTDFHVRNCGESELPDG